MTTEVDFTTYTDSDMVRSFYYQLVSGTPIDLTGYSLRMMVRRQASDATAEFECNTFNGRIWFNDPTQGAFTLQIPIAVLSILEPYTYTHSLIATAPHTFLRTDIWRGSLIHSAGPTRWELGTQ
jgi:hypothetical protein